MYFSDGLHQGNTVQVTVRGGQAHQPSSIDKNKTAQWRQERVLKTAGARRRKPQGTKPNEEPQWELLKHWYSSSEVIANWNQQRVKTDEWEKMVDAHFTGRLPHGYQNISNLVPSL